MMTLWRELTAEEVKDFRQWARDNYLPEAMEINETWHPVVKAECHLMIAEQYIIS